MSGGKRLSSAASLLLAALLPQVSSLDDSSDPATFDLPAWRPAPGDPIPFGKTLLSMGYYACDATCCSGATACLFGRMFDNGIQNQQRFACRLYSPNAKWTMDANKASASTGFGA